jgi:hypothetical protein
MWQTTPGIAAGREGERAESGERETSLFEHGNLQAEQ